MKTPDPLVNGRRLAKAKVIAAKVGVSAKTIFRWAQAGQIDRFKISERLVLFDENQVANLIESTRIGSTMQT